MPTSLGSASNKVRLLDGLDLFDHERFEPEKLVTFTQSVSVTSAPNIEFE